MTTKVRDQNPPGYASGGTEKKGVAAEEMIARGDTGMTTDEKSWERASIGHVDAAERETSADSDLGIVTHGQSSNWRRARRCRSELGRGNPP